MSKKFTGITSAGSAIPVYDKDAHSALDQKLDTAVYSAASGNFLTAVPDEYAKTSAVEDMVSAASADLNTAIGNKLDTSSFADVSGSFLTEVPESAVSGFATHEEVESATSGKMNIADMTAYQTVEDMSAYQPSGDYQAAGDYYSASNPSGFITGVDLTPYQTIEGMSAYQPVGDYYSASNPSGFIDANALTPYQTIEGMSAYQPSGDYLPASESANYYPMTGNPSGFLTEHQSLAGYMQTSGLEYDGDKISGYMGSAFKAGDELPSGVMVESAVGFNAVNEISGYNGSAIAQYGAEKQWLVHDDTLVHASNSAQYALGVNLSAVAQLLGVDETVLFESTSGTLTDVPLSESYKNFNKIKVAYDICYKVSGAELTYDFGGKVQEFMTSNVEHAGKLSVCDIVPNGVGGSTGTMVFRRKDFNMTDSAMNFINDYQLYWNGTTWSQNTNNQVYIFGVTGIGRKQ